MGNLDTSGPNADQIEFWDGEGGDGWVKQNAQLDLMLQDISAQAIQAASPSQGEHILDVGCGCGDTTLKLASRVGAQGKVLGVDISGPMLGLAHKRATEAGVSDWTRFEHADASNYDFEPATSDLLFSRFGVMFFADPPAAFGNMRKALKPGGRLAFVCWAPVIENEWILVPMGAAMQHLPAPEPTPPHAPGPFGLSDDQYTLQTLDAAGFEDVNIEKVETLLKSGQGVPRGEIADFYLENGPVSRALGQVDPATVDKVRTAIDAAIEPYYDGTTVNLKGSCWIVTARNP